MIGKTSINKLRKNYVKIPREIFHIELPAYSLALYVMLVSFSEDYHPSIRVLAKNIGIAPSTTKHYLDTLLKLNIIEKVEQGGLNRNNKYRFVPPAKWLKNGQ